MAGKVFVTLVLLTFSSVTLADDDIIYYLYNKATGTDNPSLIHLGKVEEANLDTSKPLKILCHGYLDGITSAWYASAISEYFESQDVNIIAIDWPATSLYSNTVATARTVAEVNAELIVELVNKLNVDLNNVHLIGHSLGAHISGLTGQKVLAATGQQIGRITGLDPAGPGFNGKSADERLSEDDAVFVEAIHTDGNLFGYGERLADVDYFPNGGVGTQPGCSSFGCSHNRAPSYFVESINNEDFLARQCSSKLLFTLGLCGSNVAVIMGENYSGVVTGAFYFTTNSATPFALALKGL